MTAAHCICPQEKSSLLPDPHSQNYPTPHSKAICKRPYYRNQITPGFNEISIYGGNKDLDTLKSTQNAQNTFSIKYAFIKNLRSWFPPYNFAGEDDIGLLVTDRVLFDRNKLKHTQPLDRPSIVPICLAAENTNFISEKVFGVGWGVIYDESPSAPEDPYYSSCMTNEVGPEKGRFEHCDMDWIKRKNWACEKNDYPDEIKKDLFKCRYYLLRAKSALDELQVTVMDKIDKIHIHYNIDKINTKNRLNEPFLTCYRERLFDENGWCVSMRSGKGWGFCSPSCGNNLMGVR